MRSALSYQSRRELVQQMAPRYQKASRAHKISMLDEFVAITGYARKYAIQLLNHPQEPKPRSQQTRLPHYGLEVQHALLLVWKAANQICAKRLIPFLPTLVEALERHGHLHLSEECRHQLLSISATTADRLLRASRPQGPHGLSTTRAGTLLKHQIPIRTFQDWNETQPGFLEADLVAHCGLQAEGGYLYTLTLTDIATGWTECLPLLFRSRETVLAAFQRARTLFPFPILGIDTDNGGEFLNEEVLAYCEQEQITFTRGRPYQKRDQCFVEQKNGAIVRQVVGYDRFVGEYAYRQLTELYRALRLYVNCFQPSMKLLSKQREGKKVRSVYDPAKTPLQRLLLSGALPAQKQQELIEVAHVLDPIGLFQQLKQLQKAVFYCAVSVPPLISNTPSAPVRVFSVDSCTMGSVQALSTTVYNCAQIKLTDPRDGGTLWTMLFSIPTGDGHDQEQDSEYDTRIVSTRKVHSRHRDYPGHRQEYGAQVFASPRTGRHAPSATEPSLQTGSVQRAGQAVDH